MRWILAVAASCTCFAVATSGTFLPLRQNTGLEYLFVWPGAPAAVVIAAVALVVAAVLYGLVLWTTQRWVPSNAHDARAGRWLAPLAAVGLVVFGLLPAAPGIGDRAAVVAFFLYDLRWWWALVLGAWTAWRADQLVGHPVGRRLGRVAAWSPAARLLFADVLLFTVVVAWAVVTQPTQRFNGAPMGDEPKYLRYCETWYQGRGCDVSSNTLFADTALDAPSAVLHNFVLLGGAVAEEVPALVRDLRDFAANPWGFRWNRADDGQNGFLVGKRHSGLYQVHQPGVSLILFPGYYLDRSLLGLSPGYQGEFPNDLVMTTTITLLILGVCAVALFRLLRHALASEMAAWLAAALAMLSFPLSNFAFQFYPEMPAALLVLLVTNYVCFHAGAPITAPHRAVLEAGAAAVAAGMLVWMHPRFLVLSIFLGVAAMIKNRGRARLAFFWTYAAILFALGAYDYHITGSWMPNALYAASPDERQIVASNIVDNLISYAVHGTWGLVPYAPWLLAFLPGLVVIGRRQPGRALFIAGLGLALGALAAGHALNPAGGTPGRFVVAVVPLLMWPAAVLVRQRWSQPSVRVAAIVIAVVSLHTALTYNWSHEKSEGPIINPGVTGWKPNLAFPEIREYFSDVSQPGYGVFVAIAVLVLLSIVWAYRAGTVRAETRGARRAIWPASAAIIVAVLLYSTTASAALGRWTSTEFLLSDREARRRAATALVALDRCRVCVTSTRRQVDWTWLEPNPAENPHIDLSVDNYLATLRVELESDDRGDGFGRMRVDFGDGTTTPDLGIVQRRELAHAYRTAGTYSVVVSVQLPGGVKVDTRRIVVADKKD